MEAERWWSEDGGYLLRAGIDNKGMSTGEE